ncbi:hypothetical protein CS8_066180 [Cupriavidus sp. 8B]
MKDEMVHAPIIDIAIVRHEASCSVSRERFAVVTMKNRAANSRTTNAAVARAVSRVSRIDMMARNEDGAMPHGDVAPWGTKDAVK